MSKACTWMSALPTRRNKGFTLLELLVTVVISGVLLAAGVPYMRAMQASSAVGSQSSELISSVRLARSEAIKRMTTVSVCASGNPNASAPTCSATTNWRPGWVVFVDTDADGVVDAGEKVLRVHSPLGTVDTITGPALLTFRPNGVVTQGDSRYVLSPSLTVNTDVYLKNQQTVCIRTTGRFTVVYQDLPCS